MRHRLAVTEAKPWGILKWSILYTGWLLLEFYRRKADSNAEKSTANYSVSGPPQLIAMFACTAVGCSLKLYIGSYNFVLKQIISTIDNIIIQ